MYTIAQDSLRTLLDRLSRDYLLIAPVEEDGVTRLKPAKSGAEVSLDYGNTATSLKDFLFPQSEDLLRFVTDGTLTIEEIQPDRKQVAFGIRPCDLASVALMDKVLTTGEFSDAHYQARRDNTVLVGLGCESPADTCFCTSYGYNPGYSGGADLMLYKDGDNYLAEALTEKGRTLVGGPGEGLFKPADEASGEAVKKSYVEKEVPFGSEVKVEGIDKLLDNFFNDQYWDDVSRRCLNCGTCTYVCPTCHCFLLTDEARGGQGLRFRCWDSCMFANYTKMAGGHNPRPSKKERVRQRFMHKLNYYSHRYGSYLCTGCGRCVAKCPVGLHIAGVINDVKGVKAHA
ncbi:MAG TPA: 4Fe-4S dicluster domain-containing protein [Bacillota bacterium]